MGTEVTTKTDNELIAEFMGVVEITHASLPSLWRNYAEDGNTVVWQYTSNYLRYDTSWDWLMPVVEKIKNQYHDDDAMAISMPISSSIGKVYMEVVDFIKWYNTQKNLK